MSACSRRQLLRGAAVCVAAGKELAGASAAQATAVYSRILVPPDCPLPLRTAAAELAEKVRATISSRAHDGKPQPGEIVLVTGESAGLYPELNSRLASLPAGADWELVQPSGSSLLIAGGTPRNVCRAVLGWMEDPAGETGRLSVYRYAERFTMWDNSMNQMYRFSKGFDRRRHIREIARLGHTGVEINRYADPLGYHVLHRKFPQDSYPWYVSYAPALDAFVESSLTRGIYPAEELAANLADLREAVEIARAYGLKPGFVAYEPRCVAEEVFDRHPQLRGSRTDHPGRSLQPRYALDIAHPLVLQHYAEMLTSLMRTVPDLRYFVFWSQDSGSGIPFANRLYPGPNGSFLARSKTIQEITAGFIQALLDAGRSINPEFEVIMEIGHEFTEDERLSITAALPKGSTLSHPIGGTALKGGPAGAIETYAPQDRARGVEPYALITVSAGWDAEPIVGVPAPALLAQKFDHARRLRLGRIFTMGGLFTPPQCPWHITQELYAELIRAGDMDLDDFLLRTAARWCAGHRGSARALANAWKTGSEAAAAWPKLNWYHAGPGQTQARWLTRPLVPDITRLTARERAAWERALFTLPSDIGRWNVAFEGGVRFYTDEQLDDTVRAYDAQMIPRLLETIAILDGAIREKALPVLEDQRDRYYGLLLRSRSDRNLFDAQVAINNYLLKRGDPAFERARLKKAIRAEIENTRDWISALTGRSTNFFHVAAKQETTFLHLTPVEDFRLKLSVMPVHIDDEPGPYLKELAGPKPKMQFFAAH